jgi:thiol-disulfide isomerase/thioredoxin
MRRIFVLACCMIIFNTGYAIDFIKFEKGAIEKAQKEAVHEDKLIFLDFYASWCTPCKWMEETTFNDTEVKKLIGEKYIAIKVNIDEFDGFDVKNKYDVQFLPTILVFDKNGKVIERVEETLSPSKMKLMLNRLASGNIAPVTHKVNTSPKEALKKKNSNSDQSTFRHSDYTAYNASPGETTSRDKSVYRVQVGVYSDIEGAFKRSNEIKETFLDEVSILQDEKQDKVIYRVCLGQFKSIDEARSFKLMLQNQFNINSLVF